MFGFPESLADWEAAHWIRIFAIIGGYLVLRKWIVALFEWTKKKEIDKEKKEEERIEEEQVQAKMEEMSALRKRKVAAAKKVGLDVDEYDMPSDEDVADLLADA